MLFNRFVIPPPDGGHAAQRLTPALCTRVPLSFSSRAKAARCKCLWSREQQKSQQMSRHLSSFTSCKFMAGEMEERWQQQHQDLPVSAKELRRKEEIVTLCDFPPRWQHAKLSEQESKRDFSTRGYCGFFWEKLN